MATSCEVGPSFLEILSRHGLKETDLDKECPRGVRNEVAVKLDDWKMIGCYLDFTLEKLRNIQHENESQDLCKVALLDTWNKREGKEATYLKLVRVLYRRNRRDLVEFLCAKLKSTLSLVPLSGNITSRDIPSKGLQQPYDSGSMVFSLDVTERIETLEEQFGALHERFLMELINRGVSVDRLLQALTLLPLTLRKQYESTIQSMLPELENREVIRDFFHRLNPLFTFIDYKLLQHLVSKFGSVELKTEMTSYVEKVQLFKKVTTVSELIDYWPGLEIPEVSYSKLRAKFDDDPRTYTLERLDCFRGKFFNHLRLSDFVSVSILMLLEHTNSFVAVWFVPSLVVSELIVGFSEMDSTFLQIERILELSLDERTLYQRNALSEGTAIESVSSSPLESTHKDVLEDAVYSLIVFTQLLSTHLPIKGDIYIAAHFHHTALKISKLRRKHKAFRGKRSNQFLIRNFKFKEGNSDPHLKIVVPENRSCIIEIQPEDGIIRASDIWRESQHEDLQHRLLDYHLKIIIEYTRRGVRFTHPLLHSSRIHPIRFEGSTDDSQLELKLDYFHDLGSSRLLVDDQRRRRQDPLVLSEQIAAKIMPNEDIQFGYHSKTSKQMRITDDGLVAMRLNPDGVAGDGVVYGSRPLKGRTEFEVKILSHGTDWYGTIQIGVMRCKKGVPIKHGPRDSQFAVNHCIWADQQLFNNFITHKERMDYGNVDLRDLREGDHLGLCISEDGVLEFTVNGESQGTATENIYTRNSDVYAVVDHFGNCVATVITKAVTQYEDINLQELCLNKLFSCLNDGDEVDRLPLPARLKDKLREYFYV